MTRAAFPGTFVPSPGGEPGPFDMWPQPGSTRIVLMAFGNGPEGWPVAPVAPGSEARGARVVRGEILRDPPGRLFELCGRELRPLHRLVQGPRGEILEIQPPRPRVARRTAPTAEDVRDAELVEDGSRRPVGDESARSTHAAAPVPAAFRKLFADPGAPCVVGLGAFPALLSPQIARPERLRDTHRVACHVQVYEATAAQPIDILQKAIRAEVGAQAEVRLLTDQAVERIGLAELRRVRSGAPRRPRRPGELRAGDRVFVLRLANDPTAAAPVASPAPGSAADGPVARPSHPRAASIPDRYLTPWEFPRSREEVLYEMDGEASTWRVAALLRNAWTRLARARGLKQWRARLAGRPLDEQLWAIRPPKGAPRLPAVRAWAKERLDSAGYDSSVMRREWEIYWRRKGA